MSECELNLLTTLFLHVIPDTQVTLPGLLALLARDEVESYPALRPHQAPAWHMFLVQLAALALHRIGASDLPDTEVAWAQALRGLTPEFADDEPWCLVVKDASKPAFMQPPVPDGVSLGNVTSTPDALDLLITSRNHDLKQAVARQAEVQDWVLALVSLQTSEGFGGAKNYGIVRMNGGSSSRPMLSLAPLGKDQAKSNEPCPGSWFRRDVSAMLAARAEESAKYGHVGYPRQGGIGLVWIAPWPEGEQLPLQAVDLWFIEICRRIRLSMQEGCIACVRGTSSTPRIEAKNMNGSLGDPWAPVHKTANKSFTLSSGDFDYSRLVDLLFSGDWALPLLARPASFEAENGTMALVAQALSRGNSKTEGFKSRILPMGGRVSRALGPRRQQLHELAKKQMEVISKFDAALRLALTLVAAGGDADKRRKEHYVLTDGARATLDHAADAIFFEHLWARFEAQEVGREALQAEEYRFASELHEKAETIFEAALPSMPCARLFRPRAEARARSAFRSSIQRAFPELFYARENEVLSHANA
jgi:CRISPR system Cascade subunit CasA